MILNRYSYNRIAQQWDEARRDFFGCEQAHLDLLLANLPASATVLDVGCGTGRPMAEYVLAHGYHIVGIDQSEAMLQLAQQRFPQADWREAVLETCEFAGTYNAAICWDSLFHIERQYHEPILRRIFNALVPYGKLMLTVGGSAHPAFTDYMFGHEFFYDSWPPEQATQLLESIGFEVVQAEFINPPTDGSDKGRYAMVVEKGR